MGPGDYLTIDETLYPTRGAFAFRQYNPNKPAKYGVLFRSLNAVRFPYTYMSIPYAGKPVETPNEYYVKGPENVVKTLIDKLGNYVDTRGCNISYDRYYTSLPLAKYFWDKNVSTIGTVKHNRKGFKGMGSTSEREDKSTIFYMNADNENIHLTSYVTATKNNKSQTLKNILVLSTHSKVIYGVTKDDKKKKPATIKLYDLTKGGTDSFDLRIATFSVKMKSKRWPMAPCAYLLDTARVNCQTIHALNNGCNPRSGESFERAFELAEELIVPYVRTRYVNTSRYLRDSLVEDMAKVIGVERGRPTDNRQSSSNSCTQCYSCKIACKQQKYPGSMRPRRSKNRCDTCKKPVCTNHMTTRCLQCKINK